MGGSCGDSYSTTYNVYKLGINFNITSYDIRIGNYTIHWFKLPYISVLKRTMYLKWMPYITVAMTTPDT